MKKIKTSAIFVFVIAWSIAACAKSYSQDYSFGDDQDSQNNSNNGSQVTQNMNRWNPSTQGKYLGNLNSNNFDPNSVSNPNGQYGSQFSPNSINDKSGIYRNPFAPQSVNNPYATQPPILVDPKTGKYLGNLNSNPYDPDSINNPNGTYGSKFSQDSINNPNSQYGSQFSDKSANNQWANNSPIIIAPAPSSPKQTRYYFYYRDEDFYQKYYAGPFDSIFDCLKQRAQMSQALGVSRVQPTCSSNQQ